MAEWREAGRRAATANKRVERADAEVRLLELEVSLVEHFRLTLPPDREPWDEATSTTVALTLTRYFRPRI